jgi:glycosyltransferase involved in cell wall biosynthesis
MNTIALNRLQAQYAELLAREESAVHATPCRATGYVDSPEDLAAEIQRIEALLERHELMHRAVKRSREWRRQKERDWHAMTTAMRRKHCGVAP